MIQKYLRATMLQISRYELTKRISPLSPLPGSHQYDGERCSKGTITLSYFRRPTHRTRVYAVFHPEEENVAAGATTSDEFTRKLFFPQTLRYYFFILDNDSGEPFANNSEATFLYLPERRSMKRARGSLPR